MNLKILNFARVCLIVVCMISIYQPLAQAHTLDEVDIQKTPDGYEVTINFLLSIQYQTFSPQDKGKEFYIQLKTVNFQNLTTDEADSLRERFEPSWDPNTGIPLQELTYDGSDPERPQLTLRFKQDAELSVRSSADLKSLIISVKTETPAAPGESQPIATEPAASAETTGQEIPALPKIVIPDDVDLALLMEEARQALTLNEYDRAILLYTKILLKADGQARQQAQEFLGLAYERNKQLAHAKAEYEKYLLEYPKGPDSNRVRQRLAGLVTAAKEPQAPLQPSKRAAAEPAEKPKWTVQNYGSISQFYFRDQTTLQGSTTQVNRNDLSSDLYLNSKWKSDEYDLNARLSGGHQQNFIKGGDNTDSLSAASFDVKNKDLGLYGRIGRQSLTSGGVLGRFDGLHVSSQINPIIKLNGVVGFPVDSVKNTNLETRKKFYGLNADWGPLWASWNFNTFFINQTNDGFTDRRAIGGEARYFDAQRALYTLLDYDIYFNSINIFLLNGHWSLPTKTTFSLVLDYRKSPLLATGTAIQGQGTSKLSDLKNSFSDSQIKQLAEDRTTNSKSVTAGVSQDIKENLQWTAEVTASTTEGTITSAGVDGTSEVRPDYFYLTQLIASSVFKQDDVLISGFNFSDTLANNTYTITLDERFPFSQKFHLIPKLRVDFRDNKQVSGNRTTLRPIMHLDYDLTRSARLELEGGIEYVMDHSSGIKQNSTEAFVSTGYRVSF